MSFGKFKVTGGKSGNLSQAYISLVEESLLQTNIAYDLRVWHNIDSYVFVACLSLEGKVQNWWLFFIFLLRNIWSSYSKQIQGHWKKMSIICVCFNLSYGNTSEFPTSLKYYDLRVCGELDSCLLKLEGYKFWSLDLLHR